MCSCVTGLNIIFGIELSLLVKGKFSARVQSAYRLTTSKKVRSKKQRAVLEAWANWAF